MMPYRADVVGTGTALPARVMTNHDLAEMVDTSHDWIVERTGIHQRHIAEDGQLTSDLAAEAGRNALKDAGVTPDDVDLIIVATATPDLTFPATAAIVQAKLGVKSGGRLRFASCLHRVCIRPIGG